MSRPTLLGSQQFLARQSFVELNARERAQALLDEGSYRERTTAEMLKRFDNDQAVAASGRISGDRSATTTPLMNSC
jgi:hypothetical protein